MCGICGIVEYDGGVDRNALARMTAALRHRGPDDEGFHVSNGVGLGFRRLSIIDVAGGNQPLANEEGTVFLVCNGEIYNWEELREGLERRGHRFATRADTEVLVHLWEEDGPALVQRLNGMFAFALWDAGSRTFFAARDRLGKKPLYYAETGRRLLFGSEPKALLEHPDCPRDLDHDALARYLALEYVPSPFSIFAGIRKLQPAHTLLWRSGAVAVERYWELGFGDPPPGASDEELADELRERLRESVRLRLMSEVPLGAFLSGGIDSSSVVALMSELAPGRVKTFSIAFDEPSFDESAHARRVAERFGTDHHEQTFRAQDLLEALPEVAGWLDEPFADASVLPTHMLSRFTRGSVTVALGGDGADELLAGYQTFPADRVARLYRVPRALHERVVLPLAERLPVSTRDFSLEFKLKRFLRGMSAPEEVRHQAWLGAFDQERQRTLLVRPPAGDPYEEVRRAFGRYPNADRLQRLISLYATTYLPDDILVKVDRASMACSLEVRAPFLDYTLVEFLGRVPSRLKLQGLRTKVLLKQAMADLLPPGVADRRKKGFGIPTAKWLKEDLRELLLDELSPERLRRQGLFDAREVERLVSDHLSGRRGLHKELWTLLMFQLWHRNYIERPREPRPAAMAAQIQTLPTATLPTETK
jgi:asparagine synthase (glutamine-hydrolysing)